jgi:hypothetical protein
MKLPYECKLPIFKIEHHPNNGDTLSVAKIAKTAGSPTGSHKLKRGHDSG